MLIKKNTEPKNNGEYKATAYIFSSIFINEEQKIILGLICHSVIKNIITDLQKVESVEIVRDNKNNAILILKAKDYVIDIFDILPMKNEVCEDKIKTNIYYYLDTYKSKDNLEQELKPIIEDFNNHRNILKEQIINEKTIQNFGNLNSVRSSIIASLVFNKNDFILVNKNDIEIINTTFNKKTK